MFWSATVVWSLCVCAVGVPKVTKLDGRHANYTYDGKDAWLWNVALLSTCVFVTR